MGFKEQISEYFTFSRKDRIAILTIVVLVLLVYFLPDAIKPATNKAPQTDTAWIAGLQRLEQKQPDSFQKKYPAYENDNVSNYQYDKPTGNYSFRSKGELFYFDPNTLSTDGWLKLGLREKTIHTIQNYLSKGGKFRTSEDLQRIYGLFPNEYERIAPFIRIDQQSNNDYNNTSSPYVKAKDFDNKMPRPTTNRYSMVDINAADTAAFIRLPGIGGKLAFRIVNFRDKLGGFYSVDQVKETFGLPDSTFQRIKQYLQIGGASIKKININTATVDELKVHPYIKWGLANPIIAYRKEHGNFARLEDIKKVIIVTDEVFTKIAPYLLVN